MPTLPLVGTEVVGHQRRGHTVQVVVPEDGSRDRGRVELEVRPRRAARYYYYNMN